MESDYLSWGCFLELATVRFACGTEEMVSGEADEEKAARVYLSGALAPHLEEH